MALLLRGRGLGAGRPYTADVGQLEGIAGWTVLVRRPQRRDLAAATRVARELAVEAGSDHAAVVLHRRGAPNDSAYVILPLDAFADLLLATATATATAPVPARASA